MKVFERAQALIDYTMIITDNYGAFSDPPYSTNSHNARNVNTSGALNNNNAYNGNNGLRPLWMYNFDLVG